MKLFTSDQKKDDETVINLPDEYKTYSSLVMKTYKDNLPILNLSCSDDTENKLRDGHLPLIGIDTNNNIEEVDFTSHGLTTIPTVILKFPNLKRLKLNRNEINETPKEWISKLTEIEEVQLRFNQIKEWPVTFHKMTKLHTINLGYNLLKDVSFGLFQNLSGGDVFTSLTYLDLSSNYLTTFPIRLLRFSNLKNLLINNNSIKVISPSISKLENLEELGISQCSLSEITTALLDNKKFKKLNVSNNILKGISQEISKLKLEEIDISRCDITDLTYIMMNPNLKILTGYLNKLKSFPKDLSNMTKLIDLDLAKNQLKDIPSEFQYLKNLKNLNLSQNQISIIDGNFSNCSSLEILRLDDNEIQSIDILKDFINLIELDVSNNKIKELCVSNLKKLKILKANLNLITNLPKNFNNLQDLEVLELRKNQIKDITKIYDLKQLQILYLDYNLIDKLLPDIKNLSLLRDFTLNFNEIQVLPDELRNLKKLTHFAISQNNFDFLTLSDEIEKWSKDQNIQIDHFFEIPDQITDKIFLGSFASASNRKFLKSLGITNILAAAKEVQPLFKDDFVYLYLQIYDTGQTTLKDHFQQCFEFIDSSKGCVLVHCVAGVSRSASIVIAYLMKNKGLKFEDAYKEVQSKRPSIMPNDSFRKQLRNYDRDLVFEK